ncbi:pre-mRNA-splicing factor cwc22-like [Lycium ferocissimum]|uniref:pre-mRNA-splicing factor cwc22-like n=1 Tax=Lycium ferocissimum TaxID=112874 RepID=UPI0028164947|nr:pre-mRNA-splicing factor cwc22-like [Lycium ferocissimum]
MEESIEYQKKSWIALKKSINGFLNKINKANIKHIVPELFSENLIRGRGLFCRSIMKSQLCSPVFTDVFAALVAIINTKFPQIGELLCKRMILQLQKANNNKTHTLATVKFIAHLVNQQVLHELIALELVTLLLDKPTADSVDVAVCFVKECGSMLQDLCPLGLHGIFERFRGILHEGKIDKRVQFLIEDLFALRKHKFPPAVTPELDLVDQEDQLTHEISLGDKVDPQIELDIFNPDPNFVENENKYEELQKRILGGSDDQEEEEEDDSEAEDEEEEESDCLGNRATPTQLRIEDETETNLINLRRTIYLTIMSSVDFEEAGHKLMKMKLEPGEEMELCIMLLECCSQERTYLKYYGLLGQRLCMINKLHQKNFEESFVQQYSMIHRLETNKLRNVAKFFAHLLGTDALPWHVLAYLRLTEEDTTSSSRIFIKILFQELSEQLGIRMLNERLTDPDMQESFESIFPKDNPKNTRFAINFFTSIGLGGITENLREYLKNMPRLILKQDKRVSRSGESDGESDDHQRKRRRRS